MRSGHIAEWILALFLEPDRAAAYTGDLMEEAAEHGSLWFWSSVARLAVMRFWYDISESPFLLASVLVRAFVLDIAATAAEIFVLPPLLGFLLGLIILPFALLAGWLHPAPWGTPHLEELGRWAGLLYATAIVAYPAFLIGRWVARRVPNREITACIVMCAVQPYFYGLIGLVIMQIWGASLQHYVLTHPTIDRNTDVPDWLTQMMSLVSYAGFIAGGLRTRLRRAAQ